MFVARKVLPLFLGAIILVTAAPTLADLYLEGYQANLHERFYTGADNAFIGASYDWSGVGKISDKWVVMISPTYFLTACHAKPAGVVTFHMDNDPNGPTYTYTAASDGFQPVYSGQGSDLWLGHLTTPIDPNIAYYPVLKWGDSSGNLLESNYVGQTIYVYGQSNRVGRNVISRVIDDTGDPDYTNRAVEFDYDTPGLGADEAYLVAGDSGAPSFEVYNGKLALVGIHIYNWGDPPPENGWSSGDTFVPFYIDQLNANMTGESLTIVPEPAALCLLVVGTAALLRRRNRRRHRV